MKESRFTQSTITHGTLKIQVEVTDDPSGIINGPLMDRLLRYANQATEGITTLVDSFCEGLKDSLPDGPYTISMPIPLEFPGIKLTINYELALDKELDGPTLQAAIMHAVAHAKVMTDIMFAISLVAYNQAFAASGYQEKMEKQRRHDLVSSLLNMSGLSEHPLFGGIFSEFSG